MGTRFIASGNTYPHRTRLTSWGWHWDDVRKVWMEDNGSSPDELCIQAIKKLIGVIVVEEPTP